VVKPSVAREAREAMREYRRRVMADAAEGDWRSRLLRRNAVMSLEVLVWSARSASCWTEFNGGLGEGRC
jgi:hypothetical protein